MYRSFYFKRQTGHALILSCFLSLPLTAIAEVSDYDQLVLQAREGQTAGLLSWLQQHSEQTALNANQVADWLQVAGWASEDAKVVSVWQRYHSRMVIPARGVVAVARAYRNLKQWDNSLSAWQTARRQEPDNNDIRTGWILTLSDAQQHARALDEAQRQVRLQPTAQNYQVLAYVWRAQKENQEALFAITKAGQKDAADKFIREDLLNDWTANRVAAPALALSHSMVLSDDQQRRLELNAAAELVRLSQITSRGEADRFRVADKALARYEQLLAQWEKQPEAQDDYRQARIDRLGALLARKRFADVVQEYDDLQADGKAMPEYAKGWTASALLTLRQPEASRQLYNQDAHKGDAEKEEELFYASSESEDLPAAKQIVDRMTSDTPYMLSVYGLPTQVPNDDWLTARILSGQYLLTENDLPAAEKQAEHLANGAPGNQGLRIGYASVLHARENPRAAEKQLKLAEVLEPSNLNLEREQAYVAESLQEWHQFELLTDDVVARSPEDPATKQLARTRDIHHMYELRVSGSKGISSDSPISGSHDFTFSSALYGPPMGENWRLFAGFDFATGEFEEGKGYSRNVSGGVEYTTRDNWMEVALSNQNFGRDNKLGARVSAWHDFNDHWRVGGSAERLSANTPLRALRSGVTANGGNMYVQWSPNERREWSLGIAPTWFSDGNQRMEYTLAGRERLWSGPYLTLDFTPDISVSSNSKEDVPYYNPKSDLSVVPALAAEHIMYRHYDTVWSQKMVAGAGAYWQQKHGTGAITQLGYGQRLQWNRTFDGNVMLTWDRRPYDGQQESNLGVSFEMNVRF